MEDQQANKGEKSAKQTEVWKCESCCLKFNDIIPYFMHVTGRSHRKSNSSCVSRPCGSESQDDDQGVWCPVDSSTYCDICDVSTNGPESLMYHLEGRKHQKELQKTQTENGRISKTSIRKKMKECMDENKKHVLRLKALLMNRKKYGYNCKRCGMKFTGRSPYKMHVRGKKHIKMSYKSFCRQTLNGAYQ